MNRFDVRSFRSLLKMVNMLQSIYKSVKSCVKVNGHLTDYFESYMGVKQGEPLSPLMFIFFLHDISSSINNNHIDSISLDEIHIFMLLFADDTVIFLLKRRLTNFIK